jgi:Raf kinase inhibitor-like YbhB/YbcL family protein
MLPIAHTLKSLASLPHLLLGGEPAERAGDSRLASKLLDAWFLKELSVRSPSFEDGASLPLRCSADGAGLSPALRWSELPTSVESLALLVEDPDAPTPRPFVHWLLFNVPPRLGGFPEGLVGESPAALLGGRMGRSTAMRTSWVPAAPPRGDLPHRYHFQLFGLDRMLPLHGTVGRAALLEALRDHAVAYGELTGTFQR